MAVPTKGWPFDYKEEWNRRTELFEVFISDPVQLSLSNLFYASHPIDWINDFCVTYNPRNVGMKKIPFKLFLRQEEFINYLLDCFHNKENGLVEKARDIGATWLCCAFTVWLWIYHPGSSIGWGSRKEQLVDRIGDPDSIFQKIRIILADLPSFMLPANFNMQKHATYMKIINPANGAVITGEAGDNIGRGGRSSIYFKDESAHYEHPELVEAALGDNTDVQIDISSVHGTGNIFYKRRQAGQIWTPGKQMTPGKTWVFIFDWRDHPGKTQAWYDKRRQKAADEGLLHIFAQEVDRDYSASLDRVIIPAKFIKAAIDAHIKLKWPDGGERIGFQDVADEGGDKNAYTSRKGSVITRCVDWGEGDTGVTTRRSVQYAKQDGLQELYYDCIGVGAGFKAESNRMKGEGLVPPRMKILPWDAGAKVLDPTDHLIPGDRHTPTNEDFFGNLKAQAWWRLRVRFEKTFKAVTQGAKYPINEMISLSSELENLHEIEAELSQAQIREPTATNTKVYVDKKPDGGASPNKADSIVGCFCPNRSVSILDVL